MFNLATLMNQRVLVTLLLVTLLSWAPAALAYDMPGPGRTDVWTIYAFGNAQSVHDVLRAVHNFTQSGIFRSIVGFIAVTGVIVIGLSSGFSAAVARRFIGYCMGVFLTSYAFFGIGNNGPLLVSVEVIDSADFTWKAPISVPAIVGIPAAVISTAGSELTRGLEASFSLPDELKMSQGAPFNLAAAMISDAAKARITDPSFSSSMSYYVQDCVIPAISKNTIDARVLVQSKDFLNDIKYDHQSILVNTLLKPDMEGVDQLASCSEAHTYIASYLNKRTEATDYLTNASAWAATPALSVVNSLFDSTAQYVTSGGSNGGNLVKQAAVLTAYNDAAAQAATQTGNSEFLTGLAREQAYQAQRSGWIMGAEVFNRMMGYVYAIIQVFVFAITPIVMACALIPGLGFALMKNFLQIILWLAMWQPMLAVVNFIVISMQRSELGGVLNGTFTMSNMGITTEKAANLSAAATFVGASVPMLCWAMIKGGVDFSRVIGSAAGENFSAQAANTMSSGNYSLNQGSVDSFTANKNSIASTSAQGYGFNRDSLQTNQQIGSGGVAFAGPGNAPIAATNQTTTGLAKAAMTGKTAQDMNSGSELGSHTTAYSNGNSGSEVQAETTSNGTFDGSSASGNLGGSAQFGGGGNGSKFGVDGTPNPSRGSNTNNADIGTHKEGFAMPGNLNAGIGLQVNSGNINNQAISTTKQNQEIGSKTDTGQVTNQHVNLKAAGDNASEATTATEARQQTISAPATDNYAYFALREAANMPTASANPFNHNASSAESQPAPKNFTQALHQDVNATKEGAKLFIETKDQEVAKTKENVDELVKGEKADFEKTKSDTTPSTTPPPYTPIAKVATNAADLAVAVAKEGATAAKHLANLDKYKTDILSSLNPSDKQQQPNDQAPAKGVAPAADKQQQTNTEAPAKGVAPAADKQQQTNTEAPAKGAAPASTENPPANNTAAVNLPTAKNVDTPKDPKDQESTNTQGQPLQQQPMMQPPGQPMQPVQPAPPPAPNPPAPAAQAAPTGQPQDLGIPPLTDPQAGQKAELNKAENDAKSAEERVRQAERTNTEVSNHLHGISTEDQQAMSNQGAAELQAAKEKSN